jgi:hypothetical protein
MTSNIVTKWWTGHRETDHVYIRSPNFVVNVAKNDEGYFRPLHIFHVHVYCTLFYIVCSTVKPRYNVPLYNVFPRYNVDIFWPLTIDFHVKLPLYNVRFEVTLQNFGLQRNVMSRFHCIALMRTYRETSHNTEHMMIKSGG